MYPLKDDYIPEIDRFLKEVHNVQGIKVATNPMSTQLFGEFNLVMETVQSAIKKLYENGSQFPFVIKVLNGDVSGMDIKNYKND